MCHVQHFRSEYSVLTIDVGKLIQRAFLIARLFAVEQVISVLCSIQWCHPLCSGQSDNEKALCVNTECEKITDN
jgi:hypothetical protein